jgi:type I restriction enzyme S subunit
MKNRFNLPKDWGFFKLKKLVDFENGKAHEDCAQENGSYKLVNSRFISTRGEVVKFSDEIRSPLQVGDLTMVMSDVPNGKALASCFLINEDNAYTLNQRICRLRPKRMDSKFLYYFLNRNTYYLRFDNGVSQTNLRKSEVLDCPIAYPPLPEQKAIADMLSTWDEAIEKTERLIQAKEANLKGQIQRIMGKEAIEANGWSRVHLGELFSEVTRKVGEKELTPYSISAGIGFVSQREKWGKDISGSQHKNYTHLKAGEFSYNKGNSKRYQQGCVYLLKAGEICVPNVFISFKPKAKNVVPEFFEHYFIADYHARELKRYITSGARSDGLLNLNKKDFFKIMVPCPSPDEQKAIAEALTASQHEIDLLKQLADKYKTQKRGLMQKMLTGEWRVKPEIVNQYMEA